jgi:hypothetical protein
VPHPLTRDVREKRMEHAQAMPPVSFVAKLNRWHHLMTGDESWLFLTTLPRRMYALSRDDMVTKPRRAIQSKRFMFEIMWNPSDLYVVARLLNDIKNER